MQDWSQHGADRVADTEAERDPAGTVPDPPDRPAATEESADWDELTPAETGQVPPPADVLVAGRPIGADRPPTPSAPAPRPSSPPAADPAHGGAETILESGAADGFHARWRDVQFGFVDDPHAAVRQADEMADEVIRSFTDALGAHKRALEDRWRAQGGAPPDTERLRLIVRAYREFVDRLLTT